MPTTPMADKDLLQEVEAFMKYIESPGEPEFKNRTDKTLNPSELYTTLRHKEREENVKMIIQYLYFFLKELSVIPPTELDANPYEQFRNFIIYQIKLLNEIDVIKAIIRDGQVEGSLSNWNEYYWRLRIAKIYQDAMDHLKGRFYESLKDCYHGLRVLREICRLWFDIRYRNNYPIRHSDILTYRLTRTLIKKLKRESPVN